MMNTSAAMAFEDKSAAVPGRSITLSAHALQWKILWDELLRIPAQSATMFGSGCRILDAKLPFEAYYVASGIGTPAQLLQIIKKSFGANVVQMAKMLKVSRPTIYNWDEGMPPEVDNLRRLNMVASLARDWEGLVASRVALTETTEGATLMEALSQDDLDVNVLRRTLTQVALRQTPEQAADQRCRKILAQKLAAGASAKARNDIGRERMAAGKVSYESDPEDPARIVQVQPDGTRVRGRLVGRVFVQDE